MFNVGARWGGCSVPCIGWLPYVWEGVLVPMVEEAGWAPWTFWTDI